MESSVFYLMAEKMKKYFAEHYFVLILAFFLTALILMPVILYPFLAGESYQGINIAHFGTDAHFYLTRMKDAMDGHSSGNLVLREGKDRQDNFFMYNEQILAVPIRMLGLQNRVDAVTAYHLYNFIGVFFLILLIYSLVFRISREKLLAAVVAIFVVGGYHIVYNKRLFYSDFNMYGRAMFPYISSLAFFAYLNFLVAALQIRHWARMICAGLFFGFLFYVYFFAWTFVLALNGALFLLYLLKRDWERLSTIAIVSGIGFFMGLYNLFRMAMFFSSDAGAQASYFHWSLHSRTPIFSKIGAAALALWALFFYTRRQDPNGLLILGFIIAGWVALNQQIVTGQALQIGHYYWYFIVPISIIVGFYMVWRLFEKEFMRKAACVAILLVVFFHSGVGQYRSLLETVDVKQYEQLYRPIIHALVADPDPKVILVADDPRAYLFTIYTSHDLFWHHAATQTDTPLSRFKDALYVYMYLNAESRSDFSGYINAFMTGGENGSFYKNIYMNIEGFESGLDYYEYDRALAFNDPALDEKRQKLIGELSREYNFIADRENGIVNVLKKYDVQYIVWDTNHYPEWDLSFLDEAKEIMSSSNITLLRLNFASP